MSLSEKERVKLDQLRNLISNCSELEFLKYLVDCCENVLEDERIVGETDIFSPIPMQLIKLRAEITDRLERKYGINYGKFSNRTHLLAH